jgi:hypothetical protein
VALAQCATTCPPCFNNESPGSGHGTYNQRTLLYVYIDSSWGNPTSANVWNGVNDAISKWNNTADQNSCYGRPYIDYWFQINQANGSQADVVITQGNLLQSCGSTALGPPFRITLPAFFANKDPYAVISPIVQHELGHVIGLDDAYYRGGGVFCQNVSSIMRGVQDLTSCLPVVSSIQSIDIEQSNRNLTNKSSCQNSWPGTTPTVPEAAPCPTGPSCGVYLNPDYCSYGSEFSGCPYGATLIPGSYGQDCCSTTTPIVIDVDGEGFDLTGAENGVWFDFYGTGSALKLSWTDRKSTNAWLVLDRNGNGVIDDGAEMFGNLTAQPASQSQNGFLALAVFDTPAYGGNGDGIIDQRDSVFGRLRLWQDKNHNGIAEPNEIYTLPQLGIVSINLNYTDARWVDTKGNHFRYKAVVTKADGQTSLAYDVVLVPAK